MPWTPAFRAAMVDPRERFALVPPRQLTGRTVRQVVRAGVDGDEMRLRWSNQFGRTPLRFTAMVAGHTTRVVVPTGAEITGEPLPIRVEAGADIDVTAHIDDADLATYHPSAHRTGWLDEEAHTSLYWLAGVDVARATPPSSIVVTLGDSITDGDGTTLDAHAAYPTVLASQLPQAVVLNAGISGNRLLAEGIGPSMIGRADRDLFALPGVTHVVLLAGVNDIGLAALLGERPVDAADLAAGLDHLIARIQAAGIAPVLGTLTPFAGTPLPGFDSARNQAVREEINGWIREYRQCAVVDFAAAIADPADPDRLWVGYDSGDHLHPNDAGAVALAGAALAALPGAPSVSAVPNRGDR
jgi:lysophospholipase L1-like esterase